MASYSDCKCLYSDTFYGLNCAVSVYAGRFKAFTYERPTVYFIDVTERYKGAHKTYRIVLGQYKRSGSARDRRAMLAGCDMYSALKYPFPTIRGVIEEFGYLEAAQYASRSSFEGIMLND